MAVSQSRASSAGISPRKASGVVAALLADVAQRRLDARRLLRRQATGPDDVDQLGEGRVLDRRPVRRRGGGQALAAPPDAVLVLLGRLVGWVGDAQRLVRLLGVHVRGVLGEDREDQLTGGIQAGLPGLRPVGGGEPPRGRTPAARGGTGAGSSAQALAGSAGLRARLTGFFALGFFAARLRGVGGRRACVGLTRWSRPRTWSSGSAVRIATSSTWPGRRAAGRTGPRGWRGRHAASSRVLDRHGEGLEAASWRHPPGRRCSRGLRTASLPAPRPSSAISRRVTALRQHLDVGVRDGVRAARGEPVAARDSPTGTRACPGGPASRPAIRAAGPIGRSAQSSAKLGERIVKVVMDDDLDPGRSAAAEAARSIGDSIATGRPVWAIMICSPCCTRSTRRERCVFASWMLTVVIDGS